MEQFLPGIFQLKKSQKHKYFLCGKKSNNFQIHKMSLSGNDVFEGSTENGLMSKRDKKKFEQVLRQIAASEGVDSKSHKKRRNPTERKVDPQARKLIKTQSQLSEGKNQEGSSSVRQMSEDDSKAQIKAIRREVKDLHQVYNKNYGIPEQSQGFSDYMVNYTYGEKSKYVEKQYEDWNLLENLGGKKIQVKSDLNDLEKTKSINEKLSAEKEKAQELFSKSSRQFIKRVMDQLFPKTSK